jgi:uncharacterized protein YndB with AHSA1/START domain
MQTTSTYHGTIVVEQLVEAALSRVYTAFADHKAREVWGAPSETAAFFYEEADFRVGGRILLGAEQNQTRDLLWKRNI